MVLLNTSKSKLSKLAFLTVVLNFFFLEEVKPLLSELSLRIFQIELLEMPVTAWSLQQHVQTEQFHSHFQLQYQKTFEHCLKDASFPYENVCLESYIVQIPFQIINEYKSKKEKIQVSNSEKRNDMQPELSFEMMMNLFPTLSL